MSAFSGYSREQLRQSYADAWRKHLARAPLSPLEAMIADVIGLHPEYAVVVRDTATAIGFEPDATGAAENPFFHMGLHLAIREQIAIDRPPGVRQLQQSLQAWLGGAHAAEHTLMEALGETLWEAQRAGRPPDEADYLARARQRLKG